MRIVIDMQCEQAAAIAGSPTLTDLTLQVLQYLRQGGHDVMLALSGLLPQSVGPIQAQCTNLVPIEKIRTWHTPSQGDASLNDSARLKAIAALLREAFLEFLQPDLVLIPWLDESAPPSLIQGSDASRLFSVVLRQSSNDIFCSTWPANVLLNSWPRSDQMRQGLQDLLERLAPKAPQTDLTLLSKRLRLAYLSPLPPERSGIADYSAELIPELAKYYDIDVILDPDADGNTWSAPCFTPRTVSWFLGRARDYDRVLYHFGNSKCHAYLFDLLAKVPGIVVLHDFYLGDIQLYRDSITPGTHRFANELYQSHGYCALINLFRLYPAADAHVQFPVNLKVLAHAHGVIAHSAYARQLAADWYGNKLGQNWRVIPLLRTAQSPIGRLQARKMLGLSSDAFIVASFGLVNAFKLNLPLLEAWLHSQLAQDSRCILLFVGENDTADYGRQFTQRLQSCHFADRVRITGWVDKTTYDTYLGAVDVAVQLRSTSRGETSAAVLDCMNHAIPTIVNASGSMAELPENTVRMLPEIFKQSQLVDALESLWMDLPGRVALGSQAQQLVWKQYAPQVCTRQYMQAIEGFYATAPTSTEKTINALCRLADNPLPNRECLLVAHSMAQMQYERNSVPQICVDVSATYRRDLKTGIQRVVRAIVTELVRSPPNGFRVEPVYLSDAGGRLHYRYARQWTSDILDLPTGWLADEPVMHAAGDILLVADYAGDYTSKAESEGVFARLKATGVGIHFVVYDLLPIQMPEVFPPGLHGFREWLNTVSRVADSAICISRATATALQEWLHATPVQRTRPMGVGWFHLGADVENSAPSFGLPKNANTTLERLEKVPSFLMVGTIEPRKNYLLALEAFTLLWNAGVDINLVVVGQEGWQGMADSLRRDIPDTVQRLRTHPHLNTHLFWLEGISDEYLNMVYAASTCLIAASKGEGFGLPLIEAARRGLPILASDIPVFHEVAGNSARYFTPDSPQQLAEAVTTWLAEYREDRLTLRPKLKTCTWKESANQLLQALDQGRQSSTRQL